MNDRSSSIALSVVVPVLNEARDIGRVIDELRAQAAPAGGFEVLITDGGSSDGTREIVESAARKWPALRLLANPRRLSSAGRNVGARAARGRYVLFLDGHCALPRSDYLVRVVELFASTGADCLCRPQPLDRLGGGKWARAISAARHSRLGHNPNSDIYGGAAGFTDPRSAGAAYTRDCLRALGGYDERFDACEDVEFNHRVAEAGFKSYLHPDLAVFYRPRSGPKGLFRQMYRYGRGRARLMARHPEMVPWPLAFITGFAIVLPFGLLLADPSIAPIAFLPLIAASVLMAGESVRLGGFSFGAARTALAFVVIYAGLVFGFWRGLPEWRRYRRPPSCFETPA